MDLSCRRRAGAKGSIVAGSVWETRMKSDEVKGGIKVFNGEENDNTEENSEGGNKRLSSKKGQIIGGVAVSGKRKTWKSECFEGFEKNPIQIAKGKTEEQCKELNVSVDGIKKSPIRVAKGRSEEHCKDLSLSVDGIKKTPVQVKKGRSEGIRDLSKSVDGIERSPIHMEKPRSEVPKRSAELSKDVIDSGEKIEGNSVQLRKAKSDSVKASDQSGNRNRNDGNSLQLRRSKTEENKVLVLDDQKKGKNVSIEENEKNPVKTEENGSESEENCKEFGVCQEKVISSSISNGNIVKSSPEALVDDGDCDGVEDDEEFHKEEVEKVEEIEVGNENKSFDINETNVPEEKPNKVANEVKKLPEEKPSKAVNEVKKLQEDKSSKVVNEAKKISQLHNKTAPFSSTVNKQSPPVVKRATSIYTTPTKPTKSTHFSVSDDYHYRSFPQTRNKLQNLVDLVMWRDVSHWSLGWEHLSLSQPLTPRTSTSESITKTLLDQCFYSCISVISYLGLVYLAAIFLYRSIICRGVVDIDESSCVLGEEEAVWSLKLVLPYLNEFLLKLRALFSGDPATTMKLAVLLFVLARCCSSSITIWKMAKLGFFGVFTVPRLCSSYSHQLTAYGKFCIGRFGHAWDSCTHKKAVAVAIFTLVWNLSSIVVRIWAAFMLFVALRYYQQTMVTDDWVDDEAEPGCGQTWQGPTGRQRQGLGPSRVEPIKVKKGS